MKEEYKKYINSIKKVHRFGFWKDLVYEEKVHLPIKKYLFLPLAQTVLELLEWEIILLESDTIYARSKEKWGYQGKVKISYIEYSKILISSTSAIDQRWDNGQNSIRVKLFIKVFLEELEKLSAEEKLRIEEKFELEYKWDDYEIPESLPQPNTKKTNAVIPIAGSITVIIVMGIFTGYTDYKILEGIDEFRILNIPLFTEIVLATLFWFLVTRLSKLGNFTDLKILQKLSLISLFVFYFISEITFYWLLKYPWVGVIDFFSFIINYYEPFFTHQDPIALLLNMSMLLFFIAMIAFIFWIRLISYITMLAIERVPVEVVDFVYYLSSKNKSEKEIRYELSKKGWDSKQSQDDVFESLGAMFQANEFLKI